MQLQTKPFPWGCLVTSFAMVVGVPVNTFIDIIGHDGSRVVWPKLPDPMRRAGFHVQECIWACLGLGYSVTPVELVPVSRQQGQVEQWVLGSLQTNWWRFENVLSSTTGVIDGVGRHCGHAAAYNRGNVFDPDGRIYPALREDFEGRGFYVRRAWRVEPLCT